MSTDEPFNLSAWVQGIVPATKTVKVYARPDLADDLEALRDQLANVKDGVDRGLGEAGPEVLRAQIEQAQAALDASAVEFKVEGRSSTRLTKIADEAKGAGVTDLTEILLRQIHDQIVQPEGLTLDELRHLNDVLEPQVTRLLHAAREVNTKAPRVDAPFSPGSSAARSTATS